MTCWTAAVIGRAIVLGSSNGARTELVKDESFGYKICTVTIATCKEYKSLVFLLVTESDSETVPDI